MKTLQLLLITALLLAGLLTLATWIYAKDTMQGCPQVDGSILYTNKDLTGCQALTLPGLSVAPQRPHNTTQTPTEPSALVVPGPDINDKLCGLYDEWMTLTQRTLGGFAHNTVQDTQRRLVLVQLFGAGVMPMNCHTESQ